MRLFVTGHSHCHAPFWQLARAVNQLFFGSRSTFPLNLVQVCESIWKLCNFLPKVTSIAKPPFNQLAWAQTNTFTYTRTHLTSSLTLSFSLLGWKLPKGGNFCGQTDRQTEWPVELQVTAKNVSLGLYSTCAVLLTNNEKYKITLKKNLMDNRRSC